MLDVYSINIVILGTEDKATFDENKKYFSSLEKTEAMMSMFCSEETMIGCDTNNTLRAAHRFFRVTRRQTESYSYVQASYSILSLHLCYKRI